MEGSNIEYGIYEKEYSIYEKFVGILSQWTMSLFCLLNNVFYEGMWSIRKF